MRNFPLIILLCMSLIGYIALGYFTVRTDFLQLFLEYGMLFLLFWMSFKCTITDEDLDWSIGASIVFRVALLFSLPNLSDDFYRFFWDGSLWVNGVSPFALTPTEVLNNADLASIPGINESLYQNLNSKDYFTIYPPICQFIFGVGAKLFPGNLFGAVVVMKFFILAFEIGSIFLIKKMLNYVGLTERFTLVYALNPLVIVELTGNIHFEAAMIFFTLLSVWLLIKKQWLGSAAIMSLAVCSKLLPLIFLPFLLKRLKAKSLPYYAVVGGLSVLLFLPFFNAEIVQNMWSSVDLYFQKFEFNASIYYVIREIGLLMDFEHYRITEVAGPWLAVLTFVSIMVLAFIEKNMSYHHMLFFMTLALTIYLCFATVVHPWYLCPLVALCIFSNYRYPVLWSGLVVLTYYTYLTDAYTENLYLVAFQYIAVAIFAVYEYFCHKQSNTNNLENICYMESSCLFNK